MKIGTDVGLIVLNTLAKFRIVTINSLRDINYFVRTELIKLDSIWLNCP